MIGIGGDGEGCGWGETTRYVITHNDAWIEDTEYVPNSAFMSLYRASNDAEDYCSISLVLCMSLPSWWLISSPRVINSWSSRISHVSLHLYKSCCYSHNVSMSSSIQPWHSRVSDARMACGCTCGISHECGDVCVAECICTCLAHAGTRHIWWMHPLQHMRCCRSWSTWCCGNILSWSYCIGMCGVG